MPTVFIANKSGHDFSPAREFGDIKFLTYGLMPPLSANSMYRKIYDVLKSSRPDDYLVLTGLPIIGAIAAVVFAQMHKRLNLLIYKDGKYNLRNIIINCDKYEEFCREGD